MSDWTPRFPTTEGFYWLFGPLHGGRPGLHVLKVRRRQDGGVEAVSNGTIVHAADAPGGQFLHIPDPCTPENTRAP